MARRLSIGISQARIPKPPLQALKRSDVTHSDKRRAVCYRQQRPISILPRCRPLRLPANSDRANAQQSSFQVYDSRCDVFENEPSLQPSSIPPNSAEIPSWKIAYERTMWELDKERLLALIHAAEGELFERWQELGDSPAHARERAARQIAADDLLAIKSHRRGWPDPCQ